MYASRPLSTALLPLQPREGRVKSPHAARLLLTTLKPRALGASVISVLSVLSVLSLLHPTQLSAQPTDTPSSPPPSSPPSADDPNADTPSAVNLDASLEQVSYDLYQRAQLGHVHRVGPSISPDAPGWERMTSGRGDWRPPTRSSSGRWVSYLEGRGGYLDFPITEEDQGLERLSIWLEPISKRQTLSLFLDEQLISNLTLKRSPRFYHLNLPKPLEAGEHRLRFWFRTSRPSSWGGRTAGAVGAVQLTPKGAPHTPPIQWTGEVLADQQRWGALFAPPPTSWRFYLVPPQGASLQLGAWVGQSEPVRFEVRVAVDGQPEQLLKSLTLEAQQHKLLSLDLARFAPLPIRLTLSALPAQEGARGGDTPSPSRRKGARARRRQRALKQPQVAWLSPKIIAPYPDPKPLSNVPLVLTWVIEGFNQDTLALARAHPKRFPTLSLLISRGFTLPHLWTGLTNTEEGHRLLLSPEGAPQPLPKLLGAHGVKSALISLDQPLPQAQSALFDELYEVTQEGVAGHLEGLQQLGEQLQRHREALDKGERTPLFLYLSSSELKHLTRLKHGFSSPTKRRSPPQSDSKESKNPKNSEQRAPTKPLSAKRLKAMTYEDARRALTLSQLSLLDYELSLIISELGEHQLLERTLLLLTGVPTPTPYMRDRGLLHRGTRAARALEVSSVLWHPAHLSRGRTLTGGHLSALGATIAQVCLQGEPISWPQDPLSPHLLSDLPLPPHTQRAELSGARLTRLGDLILYEQPNRPPALWHAYGDQAFKRDETQQGDLSLTHPISLRALKDGLSSAHFHEGL